MEWVRCNKRIVCCSSIIVATFSEEKLCQVYVYVIFIGSRTILTKIFLYGTGSILIRKTKAYYPKSIADTFFFNVIFRLLEVIAFGNLIIH